jgi:ATP-dependent Clp protease ATP-binding subunit ClpX
MIVEALTNSKKNFNGHAVIIANLDYSKFSELFDGDAFFPLKELSNSANLIYSPYLSKPVNMRELTFITNLNVASNMLQYGNLDNYFIHSSGCAKAIHVPKLTMFQTRRVLMESIYSKLKFCEEEAKKYGKEFVVNNKILGLMIKVCEAFNGNLMMIDAAILESFKEQMSKGYKRITIGEESFKILKDILDNESQNTWLEQAPDNVAPMHDLVEDKDSEIEEVEVDESEDLVDTVTNEITKTIRAQDKQVRRVVKIILKNMQYANDNSVTDPEKRKKNILIRGESGTGKTEIIRRLAKAINVPIFIADATQYTEEGYVGDSVNEMLLDLYHEAGDDIKKAERGILVIDEIDKKANNHGDRSDISRGAVLQSLLKIVEGTKKKIKYEEALPSGAVVRKKLDFDTNRLTVICLGAFENLEKFREERIRKATKPKGMGFQSDSDQAKARENENKVNRNFISEDYEAYGMGNQFIPRFEGKVYLNSLTKENMVDIMKNSNLSAIKLKKEEYLLDGVILEFTEDFYEKLAVIAVSKKAGARGISEALEDTFETLGLNDLDTTQYQKIILNGECITNPEALVLVPREQQKVKKL